MQNTMRYLLLFIIPALSFGYLWDFYPKDKLGNSTKFFINDLKPYVNNEKLVETPSATLIEKYDLYYKRGEWYVGVVALLNNHFEEPKWQEKGILISSSIQNIRSMRVPIRLVQSLAYHPCIDHIEAGNQIAPFLDQTLKSARADSVHSGLGGLTMPFTGKGVIVAVIDWGFDYTHPVFYDTTLQHLRISRAWDQNKMAGTPPAGYDFGAEYIGKDQLLAAKEDTVYVFGPMSHGTHVAGIAAGAGGGSKYTGVAPESELVLISLKRDDASFIDAITYLCNYADIMKKPLVVNMSFGNHLGSHDGTSLRNMAMDILSGRGKVFVGSAGNNGSDNLHLDHIFTTPDTVSTVVGFNPSLPDYYGQIIDIWGNPNTAFSVNLKVVDGSNQAVYESGYYSTSESPSVRDTGHMPDNHYLVMELESNRQHFLNNKPTVRLRLKKTNNLRVVLSIASQNNEIHMWNCSELNTRVTNWGTPLSSNFPGAKAGNSNYSVGEPNGVGKSTITVGAYYSELILSGGVVSRGLLSSFSSKGPTTDKRTKPDICGPGQEVISAFNSFNPHPGTLKDSVAFNGKNYGFINYSGTSMSSPAVAGIVALMLQANPYLSAAQVKNILKTTARTDSKTGTIGPEGTNTWGMGKANALAAILLSQVYLNIPVVVQNHSLTAYPNPAKDELTITTQLGNLLKIKIYDMQGKTVAEKIASGGKTETIATESLPKGVYVVMVETGVSVGYIKIIKE